MNEPLCLLPRTLRRALFASLAAVSAVGLVACSGSDLLPDFGDEPQWHASEPLTGENPFGLYIARTASSQIGTPYLLGGQTPGRGFDCSGLVQWVYSQYGISVPRQTTGQQHVGKPVSLSQAMAGDLIVFRSGSARNGLHTGIMTSRTTFVHAPRQGFRTREETVNSYWKRHLLTIRRVSDFSLVMDADEAAALIDKAQASRVAIKPIPRQKVRVAQTEPSTPPETPAVSVTPIAVADPGRPIPAAQAALPQAPELRSPLEKDSGQASRASSDGYSESADPLLAILQQSAPGAKPAPAAAAPGVKPPVKGKTAPKAKPRKVRKASAKNAKRAAANKASAKNAKRAAAKKVPAKARKPSIK